MIRVVGLDLSLTGTGVAQIAAPPPESGLWPEIHTHRLASAAAGNALVDRSVRLRTLAAAVLRLCEHADAVAVEQPAYGASGGSAHDRSGLWWLIVARLTAHGVPTVEIVTQHLKIYATGRGTKVDKGAVLAETARRYARLVPDLSSHDEADSLNAAALTYHRITGTSLVPLPQTHTRAVTAVRWPETITGQERHVTAAT